MRKHVVDLRPDGWVLMHTVTCRPNLFTCVYNNALLQTERPKNYSGPGLYEVELVDDVLMVGNLIEGPIKDGVEDIYELHRQYKDVTELVDMGFYNGLEFALASLEGRAPVYK